MNVRAATPEDFRAFHERTGYVLPANAKGLAVGTPARAMVAFDAWTPNSAQVHVAIEAPGVCRRLLTEAFRYVFGAVGVLVAIIRESNERSFRLARHVGFLETHRVTDGWQEGEALIVLEMRREECRWLKGAHGESGAGLRGWPCHSPLDSRALWVSAGDGCRSRFPEPLPPPHEQKESTT